MNNTRKTIAGILGGLALTGTGTLAIDKQIDPYTDRGEYLELPVKSDVQKDEKVFIAKDRPEITLDRWGGEEQIIISRTGEFSGTNRSLFSKTQKIESKDKKESVIIEPLEKEDGVKIDIILSEKPNTNVFSFDISASKELIFAYQPILSDEEQKTQGVIMSEDVKGSYAVYHREKRNEREGGMNYGSGKLFHIYRPKVIDDAGNEVWGELKYSNGQLSVTVPHEFLDNAIYPVRVDPTIGYTSIGGTAIFYPQANFKVVQGYTLPVAGNITKVMAYFDDSVVNHAAGNISMLLYNESGGTPNALLDEIVVNHVDDDVPEWETFTPSSPVSVTPETVYFGAFSGSDQVGRGDAYDPNGCNTADTYADGPADPFGSCTAVNFNQTSYLVYEGSALLLEKEVRIVPFTSSGTWIAPPGVTSAFVEGWGAGGGGTTNVGAGGAGAYAWTNTSITPGNSYTVTIGTSAVNTDGGDTSFALNFSTTTLAEGGDSGTNGCDGGLAANSIGDLTFNGGNGSCGTGDRGGGGAPGDRQAGVNGGTSGFVNGGWVNGGRGGSAVITNSDGKNFGSGGNSRTSSQASGARGHLNIIYSTTTEAGYPYVAERAFNRGQSNETYGRDHQISLPTNRQPGDLLLVFYGISTGGTISTATSTGSWTILSQTEVGTTIRGAVLYRFATGDENDNLVITPSDTPGLVSIVLRIKNAGTPTATAASSTGSTNANPPSHTAPSSQKYLWVAGAIWDDDIAAGVNVTAAPSSYHSFLFQPTRGNHVSAAVAERYVQTQTEDPGTYTSPSEAWATFTVAIPFQEQNPAKPQIIFFD